jgi:hypothetical protein
MLKSGKIFRKWKGYLGNGRKFFRIWLSVNIQKDVIP